RNYGMARQTLANAYAEQGASALWLQGLPPKAKASFDEALALVPTHTFAHYGLAAYWRKIAVEKRDKNALAQSTKELDLALRSDPKLAVAKKAREENATLQKLFDEPARKQ